MKRKLLAAAFTVVCLSTAAYGTIAYFTAEDIASNVITAGNIDLSLKETALPENSGDPVPFEDVIGVMPGTQVSKIVEVENTGDHPAYVRIRLIKEVTLAEGENGEVDLSLMGLDFNTEKWTEKDGYYYYGTALNAGEITEPLFTTVSFSKDMDNRYQDGKAMVQVFAEATQVQNNADSALEAFGWPKE